MEEFEDPTEKLKETLTEHALHADYQAKGIKAAVTAAKIELLNGIGKPAPQEAINLQQRYKDQQDEISKEAIEREALSEEHLQHHMVFARAVTLFQVAIAISAIAALSRRRKFWYFALALGALGSVFLGLGFR